MSSAKINIGGKMESRARIWTFTINNPDEKDESHLTHEKFLGGIKKLVWQIEEGEKKTPHIQGVVQFYNQVTFRNVQKKLPRAHVEICKNFFASQTYCQKKEGQIKGPFIYPEKKKKMTEAEIVEYLHRENPFKCTASKESIEWLYRKMVDLEM